MNRDWQATETRRGGAGIVQLKPLSVRVFVSAVPMCRGWGYFHWAHISLLEKLLQGHLNSTLLFPSIIPMIKGSLSVVGVKVIKSLILFRNKFFFSFYLSWDVIDKAHKWEINSLRNAEMQIYNSGSQGPVLSLVMCMLMARWRCLRVIEKRIWLLNSTCASPVVMSYLLYITIPFSSQASAHCINFRQRCVFPVILPQPYSLPSLKCIILIRHVFWEFLLSLVF